LERLKQRFCEKGLLISQKNEELLWQSESRTHTPVAAVFRITGVQYHGKIIRVTGVSDRLNVLKY